MSTITVVEPRSSALTSWLHTDNKKPCKNPFEAGLGEDAVDDDLRWSLDMKTFGFPVDLDFDPPPHVAAPKAMNRVHSYRVPPLKMTLETIQEDKLPPELHLLRSKSLPTQRRDHNLGLCRLRSYRPGQESNHLADESGRNHGRDRRDGTFFAGDGAFFAIRDGTYFAGDDRGATFRPFEGGYGVSMSGPILSTPGYEYAKSYSRRSHRFSRVSFTRMREAIRRSRLRGAVSHLLSRFRHSSRRSH